MKLLVLAGAAVASKDSTISKVIELLDELKTKVAADLAAESTMMEEYSAWADDQITKTTYAIKDESRVIEENSACVEGQTATAMKNGMAIDELGPTIAGKESEHSDSKALREQKHADFIKMEEELVGAEDQLRRAYGILKRSMTNAPGVSLAQDASVRNVVEALSTIVASTWIDSNNSRKLKSMLEDDLSFSQQPQAATKNYESKSGNILQVIDNLREETVENLKKARAAETKERHAFEMLSQSLKNEISTLTEEKDNAVAAKASAEAKSGQCAAEKKSTEETKAADENYLATTTATYEQKKTDWTARQKQAAEETEALDTARGILAGGVKVLVQTNVHTKRSNGEEVKRDRISSMLKQLGHKYKNFGLLQAASAATADPFEKVRGLISDLLSKLKEQARQEADHNEMCVRELSQNEKKKAEKEAALKKHNTRNDAAIARTQTLKSEIAALETELKDMAAAQAEATKLRNEEHEDNTKTIADNKDSAAAVAQAIKVLRDYYGGEALVQQPLADFEKTAPPAVVLQPRKSDATHGIIAVLETAEGDMTKVYMDTEASEEAALAAYNKATQEYKVSKAKKETDVAGKKQEIETLATNLAMFKQDIENTTQELDAVVATLEALHKECDAKAMSYEERKVARDAEIEGLQQAIEILAADDASLIQLSSRKGDCECDGRKATAFLAKGDCDCDF